MSESAKNSPTSPPATSGTAGTAAAKTPQSPSAKTAASVKPGVSGSSASGTSTGSGTATKSTSSTAKSPPPVNSSSKSAGGFLRRLMWRFIFLCIFIGGGGYYAYQQPSLKPHMDTAMNVVVALMADDTSDDSKKDEPEKIAKPGVSLLRKAIEARKAQTEQESQEEQDAQDTSEQEIVEQETQADESLAPTTAQAQAQVTVVESVNEISQDNTLHSADKIAALESYIADLQNAVARLQISNDDISTRFADLSSGQTAQVDLKLRLIDLKLRQTGDTNAAADELLALQNLPQINPHWLASEITRLQNTVSKHKILAVLQMLLRESSASDTANPITSNSINDFFISIFNIRHTNSRNIDDVETIQRLQLLFLGGQRTAYLNALESLAANTPDTRNRALQVELLQKYGAPDYSLNLDERQ